jgi:hypothetical protein
MLGLIDLENGRCTSITLYEDQQALEDSRDVATMLREMMEQRMDLRRRPTAKELEVGVAILNAS